MAEGAEPSFGRLVLDRAWRSAWAFFKSKLRDAIIFLMLFVAGGATYYWLYGWPATKEQVVPALVFTVGPMVALWGIVFIWHLWLAPSSLAYEAALQASARNSEKGTEAGTALPKEKPISWAIWKQKSGYNLKEFAAILANADPAREGKSSDRVAFLKLLQEDAMSGKLSVKKSRLADSYYQPDLWPAYFEIARNDAIKWAQGRGFDVSHIS